MMTQRITVGCPAAFGMMNVFTKFLENMKGWNCRAASSIQNRPRTTCRVRCVRTRGRGAACPRRFGRSVLDPVDHVDYVMHDPPT